MMNRTLRWPLLLVVLLAGPVGAIQAVEDPAGLESLRQSAESGNAEAMFELGILYEFGFRMPDNKAPALAWYRLASEAGNAKAAGRMDALRPGMSAAEIDEANRLYSEYHANIRQPALPATTPEPVPMETPGAAASEEPATSGK